MPTIRAGEKQLNGWHMRRVWFVNAIPITIAPPPPTTKKHRRRGLTVLGRGDVMMADRDPLQRTPAMSCMTPVMSRFRIGLVGSIATGAGKSYRRAQRLHHKELIVSGVTMLPRGADGVGR